MTKIKMNPDLCQGNVTCSTAFFLWQTVLQPRRASYGWRVGGPQRAEPTWCNTVDEAQVAGGGSSRTRQEGGRMMQCPRNYRQVLKQQERLQRKVKKYPKHSTRKSSVEMSWRIYFLKLRPGVGCIHQHVATPK